ncbi:MAG TPA: hydroxysqualene dehydroxylase HpnE [Terriglobia bacterium]|nr:hydroxysqualene dehydroxylase HpnE [Terriglobia bacterium]
MPEDVLIIGGGLAGLAAGVALTEAGCRVRLLEQKPYLGGRARSFREAATGSVVDNGQHLFMGCYHSTLKFFAAIGTSQTVTFDPQLRVRFLETDKKLTELRCPAFPAPWHLLFGVCLSNSFAFGEKVDVVRMGRALRDTRSTASAAGALEHLTVEEWLSELGQRESLRRNFWDLLCIAAMNEDPQITSALLFHRVLRLALFTSPLDSRLGIPRTGLSDCYTEAAAHTITDHGGSVEPQRDVRALLVSNGECHGVKLVDGSTIEAQATLSAVPWHVLPKLLPDETVTTQPFFSRILDLHPAPIISIYLWFDRAVTDLEFVGLRGTTIQWLFNKGKILGSGENYISLVLSGAHDHVARSKEDLVDTALRELRTLLPGMSDARLTHSLVIKERFATFSPCVGVEALRPSAVTPVRGLYLAGDWTDTSLPATIEGAVQSGYTAAEAILQSN